MKAAFRRIKTEEVQGEGSFVVVRPLTWGEKKKFRRATADAQKAGDELAAGPLESTIADHLVRWNWTNADGEEYPLPSECPDVFDDLFEEEMVVLINAVLGNLQGDDILVLMDGDRGKASD